jgi:uncharacterized protein with PIN domain
MRMNKNNVNEKVKLKYDGEYELISDYINQETKFKLRHLICNNIYDVKPHDFFKNNNSGRCPYCYPTKRTTKEQFIFKLNKKFGNEYSLISDFKDMNTKIILKHILCGNEFEVVPHTFMERTRCPHCSHRSFRYSSREVKEEIEKLTNKEYEVLEDYIKEDIPFLIRHNKCGYEWKVRRRNFIYNNTRCPNCYNMTNRSKAEEIIDSLFQKNNIEFNKYFIIKGCTSKNNRSLNFDYYIPKYNLLLEYDGEQHFFPRRDNLNKLENQKENDMIKNNFIVENTNYNFTRLHYKLKNKELVEIINELIENDGYLSSTTIEKNNLFVLEENLFYNEKEYYTNINKNYFE